MRRTIVVALVAALMTAGSVGCGGPSEAEKQAEAKKEKAAKKRAQERRRQAACVSTFEDLQTAVDELDSRLGVGLNYENYTTEVADVRVAYDQIDFEGLDDPVCTATVGLPLERALNQYVKAAGLWDDCFDDLDCDMDAVQPQMERHWEKASSNALVAATAMETKSD